MSNPIIANLQQTVSATTAGKCPFCDKDGLKILPLRHSAFCSEDPGALASARQVSLGETFSLGKARLTARMMREGYLYVLIDRMGLLYWKAYFVTGDARLYAFPVDAPPSRAIEFSCSRDQTNADTSVVTIEQPEQVRNTWWLFSPDPLSERKLEEYKAGREALARENKLQTFSPSGWVGGDTAQDHSLAADAIGDWAAEFVALGEGQGEFASELMRQPFRPLSSQPLTHDYAGLSNAPWQAPSLTPWLQRPRLDKLQSTLVEEGGAAFVLRDALGIVQELNAWRNGAMEGVEPWLNQKQGGVSNRWRYQVASRLLEVREDLRAHRIQQVEDRIDASVEGQHTDEYFEAMYPDENKTRREDWIRQETTRLPWRGESEQYVAQLDVRKRALERFPDTGAQAREAAREQARQVNRQLIGDDRIERHRQRAVDRADRSFSDLDLDQAEQVVAAFSAQAQRSEQVMLARVDDHLAVLQSQYLLHALHAYDDDDMPRGWAFALQVALCTLGMEACAAGEAVLVGWQRDVGIAQANLFWRAYALNQERLMKDLRSDLDQARTQAQGLAAGLDMSGVLATMARQVTQADNVIEAFEVANEALNGIEAGQASTAWFNRPYMGVLTGWYVQAAKGIFTSGTPSAADRAMAAVLMRATNWRLGRFAAELRLEELAQQGQTASFNRVRGQVRYRLDSAVQSELDAGRMGNFYALRIGVLVAVIEAANLWYRGQALPEGSRERAEFAAGALATLAVGLEVAQTGAEWATRRYSSASLVHRAAAAWGGGLRLYGGFLGAVGGVVGAVLDFSDAVDESKQGRTTLSIAYGVRATSLFAVSALSLGIALSGSGPYLKMLIERTGSAALKRMLSILTLFAEKLARRAVLLFMRTWLVRVGWVVLAVSTIIWILSPDAMQKWSSKSVFRKNSSNQSKMYENELAELAELEAAFAQMAGS